MDQAGARARLIYFLYGAVSLLAQVILIRRLLAVFYGNELTIGALFAGWMFWTGVGGFLFSRISDQSRNPGSTFAKILFLCAILFLLSAASTWLARDLFRFNPAAMPGLGRIIAAGFLISAPACLLLGAAFNYSARMLEEGVSNLVRLYLWEALGAAAAGIVFSFALAGRVPAFAQVVICGSLIWAAGALGLEGRKKTAMFFAGLIAFGLLLAFSGRLENILTEARWQGQQVVMEEESKYSTITVTRSGGQVNFFLDGLPAFSSPNPELFEQAIHLPLAMVENPKKVLLIGGGLTPALKEIFKHPAQELVYLQIDPALTVLEEKYLPEFGPAEKDPRLQILHQDARIFLRETSERFDAIILNLPDPETAGLNRYYTRDFFELVRDRLTPKGVLGFGIGISGNYLSDAEASLLANTLASLEPVFPKIALLPLSRNFLVASRSSDLLTENPDRIVAELKRRGVETRFVREYYLKDNLSPERLRSIRSSIRRFQNQPANTDLKPRGYYLSTLLWLEQANPHWRGSMKKILEIGKPPLLIGLAAFLLLSLLLGFWQGERALAIISIFAIGLAGIGSELVLMLAFQVCYGYVFNLIGILISGFMAGLALGAYAFQKLQSKLQLWPIAGLTLTLVSEALVMILCVPVLRSLSHHPLGGPVTLGIVLVLLIATAFFSGICFPLSAYLFTRRSRAGTGLIAGWINAWDHFGGSLGAVLTSVILIPLFGLEFSLFFFALLILAGLGSALTLFRSR